MEFITDRLILRSFQETDLDDLYEFLSQLEWRSVGWAACPADACDKVKSIKGIHILQRRGGDACVREWIDQILAQ